MKFSYKIIFSFALLLSSKSFAEFDAECSEKITNEVNLYLERLETLFNEKQTAFDEKLSAIMADKDKSEQVIAEYLAEELVEPINSDYEEFTLILSLMPSSYEAGKSTVDENCDLSPILNDELIDMFDGYWDVITAGLDKL